MFRIFISCTFIFVSFFSWGVTYTVPSKITNMSVGTDFARVKTEIMKSAESCSKNVWYILDMKDGKNKEMYSMLLTAKASSQKVHFQLIGCQSDYPKVSHVYNCNNASCTN